MTNQDNLTASFTQIEKHNRTLNALLTVVPKTEAEKRLSEVESTNSSSPLKGLTFVMKDSYLTKGIATTAASQVLKGYLPPYSATIYQKLLDAGAILVGKANMDAWGHGATNENSDFGPVKNPYDLTRVAGGSGGGPAAAVASGMADFAIGEDTGGSIRNPAAWCGITALKVSYGRVSRYGCIAYASSFDTVGPTARTVEQCAKVLEIIAGKDQLDATSALDAVPAYSQIITQELPKYRLGWPKELFSKELDPEIKAAIEQAREQLVKLGCEIVEISMPMLQYGINLYYIIAPSETSSNLARYDGIRYGQTRDKFGDEARRRIMIGTYTLSAGYYDAYYKKALQARTLLIEEYTKAFENCDAILMPVTPYHPTKLGEVIDDPIQNMLIDIYTVTQNPAGVPSLALPCGMSQTGLPIGLQLVGPMFSEDKLLHLGHHFQKATDWHLKEPKL